MEELKTTLKDKDQVERSVNLVDCVYAYCLKIVVANVQNTSDLRLFAPIIVFDLGATLLLKFLKLILAWSP